MKWKYLREHHRRNEKAGYDPIADFIPEEQRLLFSQFSAEREGSSERNRPERNHQKTPPDPLVHKTQPVFTDKAGRLYRYERGYRIYAPDIEAVVTFLPIRQDGRETPVWSGYSARFCHDGRGWDAHHEFPDVECVHPDQAVRVLIRFLTPEILVGQVTPGMEFQIHDANRVVANGRVTSMVRLAELAKTPADSESSSSGTGSQKRPYA